MIISVLEKNGKKYYHTISIIDKVFDNVYECYFDKVKTLVKFENIILQDLVMGVLFEIDKNDEMIVLRKAYDECN